jgi:hypothetical protein
MHQSFARAAATLALLAGSAAANAATISGPDCALAPNSVPWCWGGSALQPFRDAVTSTANFGAGGTVSTPVTATDLAAVDAPSLAGSTIFVSPWWFDSTTAQVNAVVAWFRAGGSLLLLNDQPEVDAIARALGIPTIGRSTGALSTAPFSNPLFSGPFGTATTVAQGGTTGRLDAADVAARGGTVAALNANSQVTAAFWDFGQYRDPTNALVASAGRLVILADVDMLTTVIDGGSAIYDAGIRNGQGIFGLNTMAFLVGARAVGPGPAPVPEPETLALLLVGLLGVGVITGIRRGYT